MLETEALGSEMEEACQDWRANDDGRRKVCSLVGGGFRLQSLLEKDRFRYLGHVFETIEQSKSDLDVEAESVIKSMGSRC